MKQDWPLAKSGKVLAICEPRWVGWEYQSNPKKRTYPCGGCPLRKPCIQDAPSQLSMQSMIEWVHKLNAYAEATP